MIVPRNATSENMIKAIIYTLAALDAVATMDIYLKDEDRTFLANEKISLLKVSESLLAANHTLKEHISTQSLRCQALVDFGDSALEQTMRDSKKRMQLGLGKRDA